MRIFFLLTVVLAVIVGWSTGRPAGADKTSAPAPAPLATTPPPSARPAGGWPGTVEVDRGSSGHFEIGGSIGGTPLTFVVDTGASSVAIGRADAARAGVPVSESDFKGQARTAGGTIRIAPVRLPQVRIGTIELTDVPAVVLDVADAMPLLGQSFLGRIDKVSIERDRMTLTKL